MRTVGQEYADNGPRVGREWAGVGHDSVGGDGVTNACGPAGDNRFSPSTADRVNPYALTVTGPTGAAVGGASGAVGGASVRVDSVRLTPRPPAGHRTQFFPQREASPAPTPTTDVPDRGMPGTGRSWRWVAASLGVVVAFVMGLAAASHTGESKRSQEELVSAQQQVSSLEADLERARGAVLDLETELELLRQAPPGVGAEPDVGDSVPGPQDSAVREPATDFGEGLHLVGLDITPGTYRTGQPDLFCYWERLAKNEWGGTSVLESGVPQGPSQVTIHPDDSAFFSLGCGKWELVR